MSSTHQGQAPEGKTRLTAVLGRIERAERELAQARAQLHIVLGLEPPGPIYGTLTAGLRDVLVERYPEPLRAAVIWDELLRRGIRSTSADPRQQVRVLLRRMEQEGTVKRVGRGLWRLSRKPTATQARGGR